MPPVRRIRRTRRAPPLRRRREEEPEEAIETGMDPEVRRAKANAKRRREIAKILKRAKRRRRAIQKLLVNQPLGWQKRVRHLRRALAGDMAALKSLGWKPKRSPKPGSQDGDELDDEPEPTSADTGEPDGADADADAADLADADSATEGDGKRKVPVVEVVSWLDEEVFGADTDKPFAAIKRAAVSARDKVFGSPIPLGNGAIVKAKPGYRAVTLEVKPGLYLVTVSSEAAVRQLARTAGEGEVGFLPLILAPKIIQAAKAGLGPHPAPGQAVAPPAAAPAPATPATGCDGRPCTCRK